jgi:hypothetical protein
VGLECKDDPIGRRRRHPKPFVGRACEDLSRNARRQSTDVRSAPCTAAHAEPCRIGKTAIDRIRALFGAHRSSVDDFPVGKRLGSAKIESLDAARCSPNRLPYPPIPSTRVLAKACRMVTSLPAGPGHRPVHHLADAVHSGQSTIRDGERTAVDHQLRQLRGPSRHTLSVQLFILRLVRCAPAPTCCATLSVVMPTATCRRKTPRPRKSRTANSACFVSIGRLDAPGDPQIQGNCADVSANFPRNTGQGQKSAPWPRSPFDNATLFK